MVQLLYFLLSALQMTGTDYRKWLITLLAVGTTLSEADFATSGLTDDGLTVWAGDNCLRVAEDGGDGEATRALDIHEVGIRGRHQPLELVLPLLQLRWRVQQVDVVL